MKFRHRCAALAITSWFGLCAAADADEIAGPRFDAPQLRADLQEIRRALFDMPADLSHSTDPRALDRALDELDGKLKGSAPLTRDEAWRTFATLNPLLADGHLFVGFVDWRSDVRAHLADGGSLFPVGVHVSPECNVSLRHDNRTPALAPLDGTRINSVNRMPMRDLCRQLMDRMHGDTRAFRADLLERRFWFYFWKNFGAPENYLLTFDSGYALDLPGSNDLPDLLAAEQDFDRQFELQFVPGATQEQSAGTAVLKLGSFAWPQKDDVLAFTHDAFESLHEWRVKTLVIDLRDNGGGNDDQWIEGVMPYIATKRWRTASTYRKRVVVADPAKGERAGDVVDGEMQAWYEPQTANPLHFDGKVFVAVGPGTYSSAVVMATVFQDFGFGQAIGSGKSVRANQSGGTRRTTLTNTGLIVVSPRFVLRRPSGAREPELFRPDVPFDDSVTIDDMARRLGRTK